MAQAKKDEGATAQAVGDGYEVIRTRLVQQARALAEKAEALNQARKAAFGSTELTVLSTHRARTENNCVPADIVMVGNDLLFGYNVFLGLKTETVVADVFGLQRFESVDGELDLVPVPSTDPAAQLVADPRFAHDFTELYKYYKHARLTKLSRSDNKLLAVFRMGPNPGDLRVFRWGVGRDGIPSYIDNRGERDFVFPPQHTFEWVEATRDQHVAGRFPHVNIVNTVFVETTGGSLSIKIENNTEVGEGIYSEPVDDPRQALDDAAIAYAQVGSLILLRIRPFNEKAFRYLVYATRPRTVTRIDPIGFACVELPEDHGIIFPGGYCLQDGQYKVFEGDFSDLEFERTVRAPNGEDVLYVFHRRSDGLYILLVYNLIEKRVSTPIRCHGYSLFGDGRLVVFRSDSDEPTRVHPMQMWRTPFLSDEQAAKAPRVTGPLGKIGNAELVRGISDAFAVRRLVEDTSPSRVVYEDLIAQVIRTVDLHHWLGDAGIVPSGTFLESFQSIRHTAELVVDEFEKVEALRAQAAKQLTTAQTTQEVLFKQLRPDSWTSVAPFMEALSKLRAQRGHLIGLKEIRYIDGAAVEKMEAATIDAFERVSQAAVVFLTKDDAFAPVLADIAHLTQEVGQVEKTRALQPLAEKTEGLNQGLNVLSEVVGSLKVDDPTVRTTILERISEAFGQWGRLRASLEARRKTLLRGEGEAEFAAQFKLFDQTVTSAVGIAETPDACDEQLSRLMVQMEELESRFSEFDEYITTLAAKREEVYEAFSQKKQRLLDERQRRAANLMSAAERILQGVARRAQGFKSVDELNGYFAADPMILKVRELATRLAEMGEGTRGDELLSKVKSAQQDALRGLKDKLDLFEDGDNIIRLGKHRFTVNTQPLDLTLVPDPQGTSMALSITGTDFREAVADPAFLATQPYWSQTLISETNDVYRGEYLAASLLFQAEAGTDGLSLRALHDARLNPGGLAEVVRKAAAARYEEGYERGVHDADAALILDKLLDLRDAAGLLRFAPSARALATLFWVEGVQPAARELWQRQAASLARLRQLVGASRAHEALATEIEHAVLAFAQGLDASFASLSKTAGRYLIEELGVPQPRFVCSHEAVALLQAFYAHLERHNQRTQFADDLRALEDLGPRLNMARAWVDGYVSQPADEATDGAGAAHFASEVVALLLTDGRLDRSETAARTLAQVEGLVGSHPRINNGRLDLRLDEFLPRLEHFQTTTMAGFRGYRHQRHLLIERERERLRLEEFKPKVLTSFVRNRLVNEVYLPLVGDNLAKQMGAAGEKKRTDLMGLLLVISPPGYGKTTLMEYVASRLGLVFMKVNGPSLGHDVRSLDPAEAPNATSRQEVEKINLALEMGNNVMLYLDDIQHTHPELLQKFISLCDAQRRIEGVWKGKTRTYDMRGKRFCVVMAGNPYTETGDRFQIPDMLANRADTYNLGDILSGNDDVFALSYIENAMTSNPVLQPLSTRDPGDIYKLIRMAQGEPVPTSDLAHDYSAVELGEIQAVMQRLFKIQETLLKVNQNYISSASTDDRYRTEPPFKLQGSYRNMNKLAEKTVAAMTDAELAQLLADHYVGEAQTLTTGAETNLLKLAELRGALTPEQAARWQDIKLEYVRVKKLGGAEDDPVTRVTGQLSDLGGQLLGIRSALEKPRAEAATKPTAKADGDGLPHWLADHLGRLDAILHAMEKRPVNLTIHNEPPRGVEELLGQQVAIVERTLIPLVRTAAKNMDDRQALESKIEQLMATLRGSLRPPGA